jgi:hypothetical protein
MKLLILVSLFLSQNLMAAEYGVFMVVKGQVHIESPKATTEAKVGSKISVGDTVVTEIDSRAKIVMSDRNIINISPNSKLKIEKYTNSANEKNVELNLIEGKVRNNVEQKYDNKNSKFQIRTATAVAGVRGTQFITSYDKKTRVTEVVTLRGEVRFQALVTTGNKENSEGVIIHKGEKSEVREGSAPAAPSRLPDKEIKVIDKDTNVKKDKGDDKKSIRTGGAEADRPAAGTTNQPGASTPLLDDLQTGNQDQKKGAVERKFDKSKVKIITQPN